MGNTFCKTKFGLNHQKIYLIFPEQDQYLITNLRMFKLDNKLIKKKDLQWEALGHII